VLRRPEIAGEKDDAARIDRVYRVLFGRSPAPAEVQLGRDYIAATTSGTPWERYVHALLQTNEFVWVD
jgi:hypothetical protein